MDERLITAVALVVAYVVGSRSYKSKMAGNNKKQRFIDRAKKNGCVTKGECVDFHIWRGIQDHPSQSWRSDDLIVKYKYEVDGKDDLER